MSTGSLIGGIIGAVIGFYAGGNVAAGWAIGSAIGGAVDPDVIDGPRINDRSVQVSSYGVAIPIIYGGTMGAGNVIWSTDLVESESGGKGGPEVNQFTYTVSCAILIGEPPIGGQILGVRRIWADAKLVADFSDTADPSTQAASLLFWEHCTFYRGTEDQLPDPTIELAKGAGNVSAYKGFCYIVMTDLPLQDYGNRLPQFRFETSGDLHESSDPVITYEPLRILPWSGDRPSTGAGYTEYSAFGLSTTTDYDSALADRLANPQTNAAGAFSEIFFAYTTSTNALPNLFPGGADVDDSPQYVTYMHGAGSPSVITAVATVFPDTAVQWGGPLRVAGVSPDGNGITYLTPDYGDYIVQIGHAGISEPGFVGVNTATNYPNLLDGFWPYSIIGNPIQTFRAERLPAPPPNVEGCPPGDPCLNLVPSQVPGNSNYCINCAGDVSLNTTIIYEVVTGTFKQLCLPVYAGGVLVQNGEGPVLLPDDPNYNNQDYWDELAGVAIAQGRMLDAPPGTGGVSVSQVAMGTGATAGVLVADEADTTLDAIAWDIAKRSGMPDEAIDVTALEGIVVQGYQIAREMPGRSAIDPLQQGFWWDFVESERKLKAVLRGGASAATIGLDDLGATEGDESPVAILPNRGQESELPQIVEVSYPCRLSGYETSTQRDRRTTTASRQKINIESAIVQTDQHAADMAQVLMYMTWTNRTTREWSTTRKFSHLEPTDVVTLDDGEFQHVVRITEKSEEGPVIKWKGVDERPASYSPNAVPAAGGVGIGGVRFEGPMKLELIDTAAIDESGDNPGIWAAGGGYRDEWVSGTAFKSIDDGASYSAVRQITQKATIGYALSALPDWTGGNVVDESSTLTVRMHYGTLSTITQAALLNGGNLAIVGDELLQFKRAELIATDTYLLTGFLRARKGTEQYAGTHAVNDRFVLYDPTKVYRLPDTLDGLNMPAKWKGVTTGQTLDDATAIDFTNTGASLKPLAPVHLHAIDIGGGEYRISWVRRTRLGGKWRDGVETPLSETTEAYQVVVNSDPAVTVTSPTLDITAAPGDTVTVRQLSSSIGPGFPASVELV